MMFINLDALYPIRYLCVNLMAKKVYVAAGHTIVGHSSTSAVGIGHPTCQFCDCTIRLLKIYQSLHKVKVFLLMISIIVSTHKNGDSSLKLFRTYNGSPVSTYRFR